MVGGINYIERYFSVVRENEGARSWWLDFSSWASPVLQWAQIFLDHWMGVPFTVYHSRMLQFMVDVWCGGLGNGKRRGVIVWPRSFAKSTCGRIAALYLMTEGVRLGRYVPRMFKDYDMLYVTSTEDLALQSMRPIWHELMENDRILEMYGKLLDYRNLRENLDARLSNGFQVRGLGRRAQLLGNHPGVLFCDDLENEETISTDDTRAKFRAFWDEVLNPMMLPGCPAVIIGNYIHISAWLRHIASDPESRTMLVSALMPDGEGGQLGSVWEAMYSTEWLLEYQARKPYEFATLYMNKPMIRGGSIIGVEDIRYYDEASMIGDAA